MHGLHFHARRELLAPRVTREAEARRLLNEPLLGKSVLDFLLLFSHVVLPNMLPLRGRELEPCRPKANVSRTTELFAGISYKEIKCAFGSASCALPMTCAEP